MTKFGKRLHRTIGGSAWSFKAVALMVAVAASSVGRAESIRNQWSDVEQIAPGKRVSVKLYADEPLEGALSVKGRFESANAQGITLFLANGESRTLPARAVRKVSVKRPFAKRIPGWCAVALGAGIAEILLYLSSEGTPHSVGNRLGAHGITTLPAMVAFLVWPMRTVYNMPAKHRNP